MISFDAVANNNYGFYVIDDLKSRDYTISRFQSLNEAVVEFQSIISGAGRIPVLGIEVSSGSLDLLHRVNGINVLVPEYKSENLSAAMLAVRGQLDKLVSYLRDKVGATHTYCHVLFDRVGPSCPVVSPIGKNKDVLDNRYCADKRLKSISPVGVDSINQLLIEGHGWVFYNAVREDPNAFSKNGVLCVEGVNVNYALMNNFVGTDGQMDISVHDYTEMLQRINKEFSLLVYDIKLDNYYIVDSYDSLKDAVRAWYKLPAEITAQVNQTVGYGYQQVVFNGMGKDFEEISLEEACKTYGFEHGDIEHIIAKAERKAGKTPSDRTSNEIELR